MAANREIQTCELTGRLEESEGETVTICGAGRSTLRLAPLTKTRQKQAAAPL
jgi:antitoxin (DNA-binding transcriptional repressor) of toxin-antitoxin stability system